MSSKKAKLTVMDLNPALVELGDDVMGFLNEIQLKYPDALSLASGRPDDSFFDIDSFWDYVNIYVDSLAKTSEERKKVLNSLGQYSRTKGIICEHIALYLKKDKNIDTDPRNIIVTVGTQEAIAITVITLCNKINDVILIENPAYVGITHFSIISGYNIDSIAMDHDGISLTYLENKILYYNKIGKKVKLLYVIPDFQNPTGNTMSVEKRVALLKLAKIYEFIIIEDNAYGDYKFLNKEIPTMKSLDKNKSVIYLHSFSKVICPSLRLSAMVVDQIVEGNKIELFLSDYMAQTKGYLTVNTSSINQAILAGIIIKNNFSLKKMLHPKIASLKNRKIRMIDALDKTLRGPDAKWANNITWNSPIGGFFITVCVPFEINISEMLTCAKIYNVIFTPMYFFYIGDGGKNELRLAYSNIAIDNIYSAIFNLSMYFKSKLGN